MRFPLETRYNDYAAAGHVNNAVYLTYFKIARVKAWQALAGAEADLSFVVAEATVRYASRARLGEPLAVEITTAEVRDRAWVWSYRIVDARDERPVADGRTVQVMFDFARRTPVPIPGDVRATLARV